MRISDKRMRVTHSLTTIVQWCVNCETIVYPALGFFLLTICLKYENLST